MKKTEHEFKLQKDELEAKVFEKDLKVAFFYICFHCLQIKDSMHACYMLHCAYELLKRKRE